MAWEVRGDQGAVEPELARGPNISFASVPLTATSLSLRPHRMSDRPRVIVVM